uniref:Mediator of RNA polymerase II transcription subunit 22 n=1 Tax=Bos indicus x Bos taurus TaxID=30522 RepID=A0A4W2HAT5_BOBOX
MGRGVPVHTARCLGAAPGAEGTVGHGVASVGALLSPPGAAGQGTCPRWTFSFAPQIEDETQVSRATQGEQDNYEMHVRAANIVRAGESLMKLVSDLKQFLILNDFPSVNEAIDQRNQQLRALQEECDRKLIALRDEVSIDLYELEEEYYSSSRPQGQSI